MDSLIKRFNIMKGDIVSICGAGGKTTLMFTLAAEARNLSQEKAASVLVTTTTMINMPAKTQYDYIHIGNPQELRAQSGVTVFASNMTEGGKLKGYENDNAFAGAKNFDYTFIEADGAAEKPLKAWAEYEPVIIAGTTKIIGVLNISLVGSELNKNNVHRYDLFDARYLKGDKILTTEHLRQMLLDEDGLFKGCRGHERILYVTRGKNK